MTIDDVFDLSTTSARRFEMLYSLEPAAAHECMTRFASIYTINSISKIEKFFLDTCIYDVKFDLSLKHSILSLVCFKSTSKERISNKLGASFSNVLFVSSVRGSWATVKDLLLLYEEYDELRRQYPVRRLSTFLKGTITRIFKSTLEPFNKTMDVLDAICRSRRDELEHLRSDIYDFVFVRYADRLTVENNLSLCQITYAENQCPFSGRYLMRVLEDESCHLRYRLEAGDLLRKGLIFGRTTAVDAPNAAQKLDRVNTLVEKLTTDLPYYFNSENVHLPAVEQSIRATITFLAEQTSGATHPSNLAALLSAKFAGCLNCDKVMLSLNHIFKLDFVKYSEYRLTASQVLEHLYIFIESRRDEAMRAQLFERLREELVDMHQSCSLGYVARLVNVLSGFDFGDGVGIFVSREDTMYAMFSAKIKEVIDEAPEDVKGILLEEMMTSTDDPSNRINLTRYLRPHIHHIWNYIFEQFKDELTPTDIDLYCRKISMRYDGL